MDLTLVPFQNGAVLEMNIVEPIFVQCRNKPSELALCAPGTEFNLVSYARLQRSVNNICRRVISAGIAPGSRVAVLIKDPILHVMIVIALTRLGVVTVYASSRNVQWPFKFDGAIADQDYESLEGKTVLQADHSWVEGDDRPLAEKHVYRAASDHLCRLFLMSGNDGRRTAIGMTHGMIATALDRQKLLLGPRAPFCDRTYLALPFRPLGFQVVLGTLWRGGAVVMSSDANKAMAALIAYDVQNIIAAPQGLLRLTEAMGNHSGCCRALAAVFSVRGLGQDASDRVRTRLCSNLTLGYVASDATMVASMPAQLASSDPGAAGYLLPGVLVEIVNEHDRVVSSGHEGNLRIRSEYGITEFFEDPEATRHAFRNGWFYPGDRGYLTAENVLVLSTPSASLATTEDEL
jgi:long-chain acyl-CoA synthetase